MMRTFGIRCAALLAAVATLALTLGPGRATPAPARKWYKGNLHTHTLRSDGDSSPEDVTAWYKKNHYQFLVLSDHNVLTAIDELNNVYAEKEIFRLLPGEEVTDEFEKKPVHVNAYNLNRLVNP